MADEDLDLRGSIEAAIDADGGEGTPAEAPPPPAEAPAPPPQDDPGEGKPPVGEPTEGRTRDAFGRFVPKATASEGPGAAQAAQTAPTTASAPIGQPGAAQTPAQAPAVPAPQSWSPIAREVWAKLPPQAQQEVYRREHEMQQFVNATAAQRQLGEQFYGIAQQYSTVLQAEGVDPLTVVHNAMQILTSLRMGTPQEKAQLLANVTKTYGIDLQLLDSALAGVAPPPGAAGVDPGYVQQAVSQALQPLYQAAQQRQYEQQAQANNLARSELETFAADPKNEFFQDLRGEMADIVELAERQGRQMPLAEAYHRAAMLHPEISRIMMARQTGANAHQLTDAARKARAAAVSRRSVAPVGNPGGPEPSSIRESIEAAIAAHDRV